MGGWVLTDLGAERHRSAVKPVPCTTSGKVLNRNGSLPIISTPWSFHSGQEHSVTELAKSTIVFLTSNIDPQLEAKGKRHRCWENVSQETLGET